MAKKPRSSPSIDQDFTEDEKEVADILLSLTSLIPRYDDNLILLTTPSWLSKGRRSALSMPNDVSTLLKNLQPDHPRGDSANVSREGNRRSVSPNSPLLLQLSAKCADEEGSSESTSHKKGMKDKGRHIPRSSSTSPESQRAPRTQLLFDLNLMPEYPDDQSPMSGEKSRKIEICSEENGNGGSGTSNAGSSDITTLSHDPAEANSHSSC